MTNTAGLRRAGRREAAVAVATALVLLLVGWLAGRGPGPSRSDDRGSLSAGAAAVGDIDLDVSDEVTKEQIRSCLTGSFAAGDVTVLYARVQQTSTGTVPVLVLRNTRGTLRLCDSFGADAPAQAPVTYADERHPVRFLTNGRQAWDCTGSRLSSYVASQWLSVSPDVARVDTRFVVDGEPGPWFSTSAQNGLVHLLAWLGEPQDGAAVSAEFRVLDGTGDVVPQRTLPTNPEPVPVCTGGDVQIG
jgi:hypothetical protein